MNCKLKNNEFVFKYLIGSISEMELDKFRKLCAFEPGDEIKLENVKDADLTNIKAVIVISPDHKDEIGRAVAALKEKNTEYCYYLFFMNSYKITSPILQTLDETDFSDANGNTIKSSSCCASFSIEFSNARNNRIILEKGVVSENLHILCMGRNACVNIEKYVVFKSCYIECGNGSSIKIGSNCSFDGKCEILCADDNFYLVNGETNSIEAVENNVSVNEHVKIDRNVILIKGADIGSGAVIAPYSVVDSIIPPCSLASGNRAMVTRSDISWASDSRKPVNLYDIKDRPAVKYFTNKKTVFIHGSCVSRTIVDYCVEVHVEYHMLQNPIHTMFFKGIKVDPDEIKSENNSRFMRKTLMTEFSKNQLNCIKDNIADFYIMDLADIRFSFFEFKNYPDIRLYGHFDIYNTLDGLRKKDKDMDFIKKGFDTIPIEEWKSYIDKYLDYVLRFYPKNRIIFIKVPVAKEYSKDGNNVEFDKGLLEIRMEPLLRELEEYVVNTKLSGANIIEIPQNIVGDGNHSLGALPLHYTRDIYIKIARKIDECIGK